MPGQAPLVGGQLELPRCPTRSQIVDSDDPHDTTKFLGSCPSRLDTHFFGDSIEHLVPAFAADANTRVLNLSYRTGVGRIGRVRR
jgi:hypothetical protein